MVKTVMNRRNRLGFEYLPHDLLKQAKNVEKAAKTYRYSARLFYIGTILIVLASIGMLAYQFMKLGAIGTLIAFIAATFVAIITFKFCGNIYSIKPFYKYLNKDA